MNDFIVDTATLDLVIENGDLKTGPADRQHQALLLTLDKGSFKENPAVGVGAAKYIEAEDPASFLREVRTQFTSDGMDVQEVGFTGNKLTITAPYK
jgi:hypothetical protein